jgi:hypothetical protein
MKARQSATHDITSPHDARIDAALRVFTHAEPSPGLESRVAERLAGARPDRHYHFSFARVFSFPGLSGFLVLQRLSAGALVTAAGAAIVVGTIHHSERAMPPQALRSGAAGGVGSANRVHVPTHAMPQGAGIDPAAPLAAPRGVPHGRASVSRNQAHRAPGAAVPRSPYPPGRQPADPAANPNQ